MQHIDLCITSNKKQEYFVVGRICGLVTSFQMSYFNTHYSVVSYTNGRTRERKA